jgi:hypothetical protein
MKAMASARYQCTQARKAKSELSGERATAAEAKKERDKALKQIDSLNEGVYQTHTHTHKRERLRL